MSAYVFSFLDVFWAHEKCCPSLFAYVAFFVFCAFFVCESFS